MRSYVVDVQMRVVSDGLKPETLVGHLRTILGHSYYTHGGDKRIYLNDAAAANLQHLQDIGIVVERYTIQKRWEEVDMHRALQHAEGRKVVPRHTTRVPPPSGAAETSVSEFEDGTATCCYVARRDGEHIIKWWLYR